MDDLAKQIVAIVFSGGLGLAAYDAGAFEEFAKHDGPPDWVTGSSAGAVTAALIAGSRSESQVVTLRKFWKCPPALMSRSHLTGWLGAVETRVFRSNGHFVPRLRHMDHVLASCGLLPKFAPVEIGGRLFADGGLSLNAPFEPVLEADTGSLVLRPQSLEAAPERKSDLMFRNQTALRLRYLLVAGRASRPGRKENLDTVILLSYRPGPEEAGPEKSFDLAASGLALQWEAGKLDMERGRPALGQGRACTLSAASRQDDAEDPCSRSWNAFGSAISTSRRNNLPDTYSRLASSLSENLPPMRLRCTCPPRSNSFVQIIETGTLSVR